MADRIPIDPRAVKMMREIFEDAQKEISFVLQKYKLLNVNGYELGRLQVILKQVDEILERTEADSALWMEEWLPRAYEKGTLYATQSLKDAGMAAGEIKSGFAVVDEEQLTALAESMVLGLRAARTSMLYNLDLAIRSSQLPAGIETLATKTVARNLITGEAIAGMKRDLLSRVLSGDVVPKGYKGSLADYAELLARTRSREAQVAGMVQTCVKNGVDLVEIPFHAGACPICSPWQGAVFSISGEDERFPPLSVVGPPPWHPNCEDVLRPVVKELATEEEMAGFVEKTKAALKKAA